MKTPRTQHRCPPVAEGFTLIELLVVVTIIAILAGLTLSTMGYVQSKGAKSRAEAEVAALSAAIDAYKLDNGDYPPMDSINATTAVYSNLCPTGAGKVYFEPTAGMVYTNSKPYYFIDPWGTAYVYKTGAAATYNSSNFFDLYSTAGTSNNPINEPKWIKNW